MSRPTPTQEENDRAMTEGAPLTHEYDGSELDLKAMPPEQRPPAGAPGEPGTLPETGGGEPSEPASPDTPLEPGEPPAEERQMQAKPGGTYQTRAVRPGPRAKPATESD